MNGPPASRLALISDLPGLSPGDKVRFLGCVERYDIPTGTLILKHAFPKDVPLVLAHVNIDLVLETVKGSDLQVGAWVNIIGYVAAPKVEDRGGKRSSKSRPSHQEVHLRATILWPAGELRLDVYEEAVEKRKMIEALRHQS